jgi:hypothetical protein
MPGLVPGIYVLAPIRQEKGMHAEASPAMTSQQKGSISLAAF